MELFNDNKKENVTEIRSMFLDKLDIDVSNWFHIYSACLGKMLVMQNMCHELVVKDRDWNLDFNKGIISFGDDEYPIQFLGSESASSNTWLWGWENINGFSNEIVGMAYYIKEMGNKWGLEPFTTAKFELDDTFNGHNLSIVSCGISNNYCYYRCPHSGGAIFVAFSNFAKEIFDPIDALKFTTLTIECIQKFHIDHKIFVEALLSWNGTSYEWNENILTAHFKNDVLIEYEQAGEFLRIKNVNNS